VPFIPVTSFILEQVRHLLELFFH